MVVLGEGLPWFNPHPEVRGYPRVEQVDRGWSCHTKGLAFMMSRIVRGMIAVDDGSLGGGNPARRW